jgi:hypothetical protein
VQRSRALKSGTNSLKGETYYYKRSDKLASTDFFILKTGGTKPALKYDRPGFNVGGPIVMPGVYNGRDRTFFFGAVEWLYDQFPEPDFRTVPTQVMRRNDPRIRLANNLRYFPSRVPGLRLPGLDLWDISIIKQVHTGSRVRAQFHVELLNALNAVVFDTPNTDPTNADFGKVTNQFNLPRDIQLALKLLF